MGIFYLEARMALPYTPQTWSDSPATTTPLSAARLTVMETGIKDLSDALLTGSAWTTYSPTMTGATIGNGAVSGRYVRVGKLIVFSSTFTLGSTSAITGILSFSLPVTALSAAWPGIGQLVDTGSDYYAVIVNPTTTVGQLFAMSTSGAYASIGIPSATAPFTWTTGDIVRLSGFYEAA